MKRVLYGLALVWAGATAYTMAWLAHRASSPPPLNLDTVVRSAKAACDPMEVEGARTDGKTYFTFTCRSEFDLGVCRPTRSGKVASAPVPP